MIEKKSSATWGQGARRIVKWLRGSTGRRRDERGAAAIEFALMLPLLVLILLGTIDLGRFAYYAISVANAARTGAAMCTYESSCILSEMSTDITAAVQKDAPYLNLAPSQIDLNTAACTPAPCLRVTVRYEFKTLIAWPGIPPSFWTVATSRLPTGLGGG